MSTPRPGIRRPNPVLISLAGLTPSLAVTTRVSTAVVLGLVASAVLLASAPIASLLRQVVPRKYRLAVTLGLLGTFSAVATLLMQVLAPEMHAALGIYLPLTAVNCLILGRVQSVAWQEAPSQSTLDALLMSIGFVFALLAIAVPRELLGFGTLTLLAIGDFDGVLRIPALAESPVAMASMGAGGLIVLGYFIGLARPAARKGQR